MVSYGEEFVVMAGYDEFLDKIVHEFGDEFLIENGILCNHNGIHLSETEPKGKINYIMQSIRNNYFKFQMEKITKAFQNQSIPHFFFKGLTLLTDLYEADEMRRCTDIDLFIPSDFLPISLDVLGAIGFYHQHQPVSSKRYADYKVVLGAHLDHFYDFETKVPIEVHLSPVYCSRTASENEINRNSILYLYNKTRWITIDDVIYPTFSITVTLFSLMEHFVRHIACDIAYSVMDQNNTLYIPFKTLFDCCRLIKKYNHEIDWDELYKLSVIFDNFTVIHIACKAIIEFDSDMKYMIPMLKNNMDYVSKSSYERILKRLNQTDIIELYKNRKNQKFIRDLYWHGAEKPSRKVDEYKDGKQVYYLDDRSACLFNRTSDAHALLIKEQKPSSVACLACYIHKDAFCFHFDYILPDWVKNDSQITLHFFLFDAFSITKNLFMNSGIIHVYLTSSMQVISCIKGETDTNIHLFEYSAECIEGVLHIQASIPFVHVPYFTLSPETIYYDFHFFHRKMDQHCIRQLFLWNYTEECDLTTMNRINTI